MLAHGAIRYKDSIIEDCRNDAKTDKTLILCDKILYNIELYKNEPIKYDSCYFKEELISNNPTTVAKTTDFICGQQQQKDEDCPSNLTKYVQWLNQSEAAGLELEQCVNYLDKKATASTQSPSEGSSSIPLQDSEVAPSGQNYNYDNEL